MSISTEITRIQSLRNTLRTKLVSMLGISSGADLSACVEAVVDITDNGAVSAQLENSTDVYQIPQGYHNGSGTVSYAGKEVTLQSKSVTPTKNAQTVSPDSGYDGLSSVAVGAIPAAYQDVTGVTATAANVLAGSVFVNTSGTEVAGTMTNNGTVSASIDGLTTTSYTIPKGYHSGTGTVSLDSSIETALAAI